MEVDSPPWGSLREMLCFATVGTVWPILLWLGFLLLCVVTPFHTGQGLAVMYVFGKSRWDEM